MYSIFTYCQNMESALLFKQKQWLVYEDPPPPPLSNENVLIAQKTWNFMEMCKTKSNVVKNQGGCRFPACTIFLLHPIFFYFLFYFIFFEGGGRGFTPPSKIRLKQLRQYFPKWCLWCILCSETKPLKRYISKIGNIDLSLNISTNTLQRWFLCC